MNSRNEELRVLLFAPQGFEDIEVAAFTDILGWTRVLKDVKPVECDITSFKRYVSSKHGLTLKAHRLLKDVKHEDYSALIIPGGFSDSGYMEVYNNQALDLIRSIYSNNGIIAAMCVGSLAVAKAGILKNRKATTYTASKRHNNLSILSDYGAIVSDERIVVADRIITNRGPDTSVETAFILLEMLIGRKGMQEVRRALMFDRK